MSSVAKLSNNKRIAKNAVALSVRMLLSTFVSLYTSRVVLNTLGVEDFGIYGVVGGVVGMLGFLNASMSGATSRFLAFELGRGDKERLRDTFNSALIIHAAISLIVLLVAETVGLWFVNTQLVIPESRMVAANWVYQFSVLSAVFTITQVPYNASIIANEKMDVYAYVEMLNVGLKLLIVYLLVIGDCDKLILYGLLTFIVSLLIALIYRGYCIRRFEECSLRWVWKKDILKPMLSFSSWDLYGNMCVTVRQQGSNMLLNVFFGPVVNAANGIATTVNGVLCSLSHNILAAFKPSVIKLYSAGIWPNFNQLLVAAAQITSCVFLLFAIPCFLEMPFILKLWLNQVPEYVADFCRLSLISNFIGLLNTVVNIGVHATGQVKWNSVITGSLFLTSLVISYLFLKLGFTPHVVYVVSCFMMVVILSANVLILKKQVVEFNVRTFVKGLFRITIIGMTAIVPALICGKISSNDYVRLLAEILVVVVTLLSLMYIVVLTKVQKQDVLIYIRRTFNFR